MLPALNTEKSGAVIAPSAPDEKHHACRRATTDLPIPLSSFAMRRGISRVCSPTVRRPADVWIIPYRPIVARVSVPSRIYNLFAVGRPSQFRLGIDAERGKYWLGRKTGSSISPRPFDRRQLIPRRLWQKADAPLLLHNAILRTRHSLLSASRQRRHARQPLGRSRRGIKMPEPSQSRCSAGPA
jgi:hypothetical protein